MLFTSEGLLIQVQEDLTKSALRPLFFASNSPFSDTDALPSLTTLGSSVLAGQVTP